MMLENLFDNAKGSSQPQSTNSGATNLTRRSFLASQLSLLGLLSADVSVRGCADGEKPGAGFYRLMLGDFESRLRYLTAPIYSLLRSAGRPRSDRRCH